MNKNIKTHVHTAFKRLISDQRHTETESKGMEKCFMQM